MLRRVAAAAAAAAGATKGTVADSQRNNTVDDALSHSEESPDYIIMLLSN